MRAHELNFLRLIIKQRWICQRYSLFADLRQSHGHACFQVHTELRHRGGVWSDDCFFECVRFSERLEESNGKITENGQAHHQEDREESAVGQVLARASGFGPTQFERVPRNRSLISGGNDMAKKAKKLNTKKLEKKAPLRHWK